MRFPSKLRRWAGVAVLALVAGGLLSACSDNGATFINPQGPVANAESNLFWFILIVATLIFVGVVSALIFGIVRYRDRPNAPEARQFHGNTKLEIAWTITPSVILFIILAVTIGTMFAIASPPGNQTDITVNAIGHQWWWEFQYPDQHIVTADEMVIPINARVHVNLISDNVIHSFWVPSLAGKTDVIPGHDNTLWLKGTSIGQFRGECAEFCGTQHAHMDFQVDVRSQNDYQAWVSQQQATAAAPVPGSLEAQGEQVFLHSGCVSCHVIDGVANIGKIHIGPNLTHFGSRQWIAGEVLPNQPAELADWIHSAQTYKSGSDMPDFNGSPGSQGNLTTDQLNALVAYLESLK